ncbi:MAG: hypothetical protein IJU91_04195, partial [Selenomonadaceae bacterium]|nr:hypothetical protein [Selenomonadaceae bacterium]
GAGNDHIHNDAENVTILYEKNPGNDVIHNFGAGTTIFFTESTVDDIIYADRNRILFNTSNSIYLSSSIEGSNLDITYKFSDGAEYVYSNGSYVQK